MQINIYIYAYLYIYILIQNIRSLSPQPRKQAQRLANMFGFRPVSNEKPGSHLPVDAPELEAVRTYIQNLEKRELIVHHASAMQALRQADRLGGNFDQVWSTIFRPQKKNLAKRRVKERPGPKMSGREARL